MADDGVLDSEHREERAFKADRYRPAQYAKALKILAKENVRWKQVSQDEFVTIIGVDDAKRHKVLKDIALELRHPKNELDSLEAQIRDALDDARIRPVHWFG